MRDVKHFIFVVPKKESLIVINVKPFHVQKFKSFAKRWLKYGQDFVANQKLLKQAGEMEFLKQYNQRTV